MDLDDLISKIKAEQILPQRVVRSLLRKAKEVFFEESNVQPVQAPVIVVGDIHGQFYDMLEMLDKCGEISKTRFVFMGDFVDRGYHSVETITLVLLLKLKHPQRVTILRGNHQTRWISHQYGFYDQVGLKYGNYSLWNDFNDLFDYLPLAALIQNSIFCVHGGLSPFVKTIDQLRSLFRMQQISMNGPLTDLVWSDPQNVNQWQKSPRGAGWLFGEKVVKQFTYLNKVQMMARSHQIAQQGFHWMFGQLLVTVWSAPNYCYKTGNKASVMKINMALAHQFVLFDASQKSKKLIHYQQTLPYFL